MKRELFWKVTALAVTLVSLLALFRWTSVPPAVKAQAPSPTIIDKHSFVNHLGAIPVTALFVPDVDGDFRITVTIDGTSSAYGHTTVLHWNSPYAPQSQMSCVGALNSCSTAFRIRAKAGAPVTIQEDYDPDPMPYTVIVTSEEL